MAFALEKNGQECQITNDSSVPLITLDSSDGNVIVGSASLGTGTVSMFDQSDPRKSVSIQAPSSIASNVTLTLPNTSGNSGDVLTTNGNGVLSWISSVNKGVIPFGMNSARTNETDMARVINGGDTIHGYRIPSDTTLVRASLQYRCTSHSSNGAATLTLFKNGVATSETVSTGTITGTSNNLGVVDTIDLTLAAGDTLAAQWTVPSGITTQDVTILLEYTA